MSIPTLGHPVTAAHTVHKPWGVRWLKTLTVLNLGGMTPPERGRELGGDDASDYNVKLNKYLQGPFVQRLCQCVAQLWSPLSCACPCGAVEVCM